MTEEKIPLGSVLVVGSGIFGMQSALDLAESGFLVHLIEKKRTIGGILPQRDKLFPNDSCALCTMSPLLIDVIRQPNINILTDSELINLVGQAGHFMVTVLKKSAGMEKINASCWACTRLQQTEGTEQAKELPCKIVPKGFDPEETNVEEKIELEVGAVILANRHDLGLIKSLGAVGSKKGIFTGSVSYEPRDITENLVEAGAVAAAVSQLLAPARGSLVRQPKYISERNVSRENPRVGVFVCGGGMNISGVVNVPQVTEYAKNLEQVAYVQDFLYLCSHHSREKIKEAIVKHNLNRIVVAACTPLTHAALFQDCLQEIGLNPQLYEQANIREQVAWVHLELPGKATEKAKDLLKMAVVKARLQKPTEKTRFDFSRCALVVGGGIAGMTNALSLGNQGYEVILVEKTSKLGGHTRSLKYTLTGVNPMLVIQQLEKQITEHPRIRVIYNAAIQRVDGSVGNYRTVFKVNGNDSLEVKHGIVILAVGAQAVQTTEYLYGQHPLVITQQELEGCMDLLKLSNLKTLVMIQCVGSREENRPYCSKICCNQAIKNAIKIKEQNPDTEIYILYRDIGTGFKERYYSIARQKGVHLIRYHVNHKPLVAPHGETVSLSVMDEITGFPLELEVDLLVLSTGIKPHEANQLLSKLFKTPLNKQGFLASVDHKYKPLVCPAEGVYMCGMVQGPSTLEESIAQAEAAAVRAVAFLAREHLESPAYIATVDEELCRGCGLCSKNCPYDARVLDKYKNIFRVQETLCKGCGICVSVCPSGASQQRGFAKEQLLNMIDAALD